MKKFIFAAAAALTLSACVEPIPKAELPVQKASIPQSTVNMVHAVMREKMKDPESAKFRRLVTYRSGLGDQIICGEYDAKNSYGGYTGYKNYYARVRGGEILIMHTDSTGSYTDYAHQGCAQAATGKIIAPAAHVTG